MLDQLVESRGNSGAQRRLVGFLGLFGALILAIALGAYLWSLIDMANNSTLSADLDLDTLVAPVALPDEAPPPPEVKPEVKKQESDLPTRKENIANMMETPPDVPKEVSSKQNTSKERPMGKFNEGPVDSGDVNPNQQGPPSREGVSAGPGGSGQPVGGGGTGDDEPPPQMTPPPTATPKPKPPAIVSKGVVNGNAISLPKPAYPPTAKAVGAGGAVSVQVTIDENGNVISAVATSGHPLLKSVAAQAARGAKFRPTLLSGQAVKVSGIIVYNFQ